MLLLAALSLPVHAETLADEAPSEVPEEAANPWDETGFGFGGLPALAYNSDDGFGYGALASVYRYDGGTAPYKWSATILLYKTTKKVHVHRVDFDVQDVAGKPLRAQGRVEFYATRSANFCDVNPQNFCDETNAVAAADALGITDETERDDFVRRYYKVRRIVPNGTLNLKYKVNDLPHKLEILGGWYGEYIVPGDLDGETGPYPGSRYDELFPGGEEGMFSTLQLGASLDNRDNEPSPTTGYWAEASLRGGHQYIGSDWDYFGYNLTLRGYVNPVHRLVLTSRLVHDGIVGEVPVTGLGRPGGSQIYAMWGGQRAGRGTRSNGVLGKARFLGQAEARWTVANFTVKGVEVDVTPVAFSDNGWWAEDLSGIGDGRFVTGYGGGLRLGFNKNFIIRADVGMSPLESNATQVYIDIRNLW